MGFLKKRGGFLNNVDGVIVSYRWTDESPSKDGPVAFTPGKVKDPKNPGKMKEKFHSLYLELHARADGAKDEASTSLFAGGYDDYEVSEDGQVLSSVDGESPVSIGEDTAAGILVASLVQAGFPASEVPGLEDDSANIDLTPIVGARVRFVQRKNLERTKNFGKRKDKKTGKEYDQTDLVVDQYYSQAAAPAAAPAPAKAAKAAPAAKAAGKAATKGNGKANGEEVALLAQQTLIDVLGDHEGEIAKPKLSMEFTRRLMRNPLREDAKKWIFNDDNLGSIQGVTYDPASGAIVAN